MLVVCSSGAGVNVKVTLFPTLTEAFNVTFKPAILTTVLSLVIPVPLTKSPRFIPEILATGTVAELTALVVVVVAIDNSKLALSLTATL